MSESLHAKQLAETMNFPDCVFAKKLQLKAVHQAHLALRTIRQFCQSADTEFKPIHVPQYGRLLGLPDDVIAEVRAWALATSKELWTRMTNHRDRLPLGHDGYLKLWALGRPKLGFEYILLDEAQDTNPVVLGVLGEQQAQIVYVGDKHQQIYEWRGAVNAMQTIANCEEAYLCQSFRFGQAIAEAASRVLRTLGETRPIRGNPKVNSVIGSNGNTKAVLARRNATVILEVLEALSRGRKPYVIGGTKELQRLLSDVFELKDGKPGTSPEFFGFQNWDEVVAFSQTEEGEDLRTFVQLVEQYGERKLWAAVKSAEDNEANADVILSTAHKAKGREWESVHLAPDFMSSRLNVKDPDAESEVRLFYVAMTRAQRYLSVDPVMLETFASGSWKTAPPIAKAERPAPREVRPAAPTPIRPAAAPPQPRPAAAPVQPRPAPAQPRPTLVNERVPPSVRQQHPGAAPVQARTPHRPAPPLRPSTPRPTPPPPATAQTQPNFWKRFARLFGSS